MKNFIYNSPTKIIFGQDQIMALKDELQTKNVKKALLVYGKSSIKNSGLYDQILSITNDLGISIFEESNIEPNPDISSVRSGIKTCLEENVDFIIAAGGGSVIDCAKAIGFGVYFDGDIWDVYLRKDDSPKSLPIGVIITLAATGTETNGNSVISNSETNEKRSVAYPHSIPCFAIVDPTYTLTVNRHHTIAGSIDIIMHILEQYMSITKHTVTSDYMSIGIIKSVIENTSKYIDGSNTYEVRSNLSWASTIALNWILGVDKIGDWATHRLSYVITREHGITHGYALAMLFTSWARVSMKYNKEVMTRRLNLLGKELFNNVEGLDVLDALDALFSSWGAETKMIQSFESSKEDIKRYVDTALALGNVGTVVSIDEDKATEIFNLSNRK